MQKELTRREREIMDILLTLGEASAEDVRSKLSNPPSYSTARVMLSRLEAKGFVRHREAGLRYVYSPVVSRAKARRSAIERLINVFYEGSLAKALTGLVDASASNLTAEELDAIEAAIVHARRAARKGSRRK